MKMKKKKKRSHRCDINIEDLSLDIRRKYAKFKKCLSMRMPMQIK